MLDHNVDTMQCMLFLVLHRRVLVLLSELVLQACGSGHHRYHGRGIKVGHENPPSWSKVFCINFQVVFMNFFVILAYVFRRQETISLLAEKREIPFSA